MFWNVNGVGVGGGVLVRHGLGKCVRRSRLFAKSRNLVKSNLIDKPLYQWINLKGLCGPERPAE